MVFQEHDHAVKGEFRLITQDGFIEVIEDILDDIGLEHCVEDEIDVVLCVFLGGVALKFLACIEVALGAGQHGIFHTTLQVKTE